MIGHMLDTDHLSLLERGDPLVTTRLTSHRAEDVAISIVTVEESLRGRLAAIARATTGVEWIKSHREFRESVGLIGRLPILNHDHSAEDVFRSMRSIPQAADRVPKSEDCIGRTGEFLRPRDPEPRRFRPGPRTGHRGLVGRLNPGGGDKPSEVGPARR